MYLPQDYSPLVAAMVERFPQVLVHPDIELGQRAYFSWAEHRADSTLSQTLWVPAPAALQANEDFLGRGVLPLVFAAGNTVAVGELLQDDIQCQLTQIALDKRQAPTSGLLARCTAKGPRESPSL